MWYIHIFCGTNEICDQLFIKNMLKEAINSLEKQDSASKTTNFYIDAPRGVRKNLYFYFPYAFELIVVTSLTILFT